ncbi:mitochondrial inner membrane protein OXA1L-like [Diaphorina citri]|uniref:Mitochondrial inner membrane protein OXA1L-like n=1 Tax=Diaphorina citri TaxID=121845 RepID=A0A3Q0J1P6_DIACI|nr:mitochondrial inner membrane protein OXA1L-like [Diaphorina citri]
MDKSNIGSPEIVETVTPTSIPEAPMSKIAELIQELAKEPPIEELGLGGWTPSGMVQQCLEYLHIGLDMPWWQAIIAATVFVRLCMFPITIMSQKNAIKMHNTLPEMSILSYGVPCTFMGTHIRRAEALHHSEELHPST